MRRRRRPTVNLGVECMRALLGIERQLDDWKRALVRAFPVPGWCQKCGCSEYEPCEGGCGWANAQHTICTACVEPKPRPRRK